MLHFVIGPARSGKSAYAEHLLSQCSGRTVYIGTLPVAPPYKKVIQQHQERRPDHWHLVELVGNPEMDYQVVLNLIDQFQNILLDGITFYLLRQMTLFGELSLVHYNILPLLNKAASSSGKIFIVDPPVPLLLSRVERSFLRKVHSLIIHRASSIHLVVNGTSTQITRGIALRLDRIGAEGG